MGASASTLSSMSPANSAEMTRLLKIELESCETKNLSDEDTQAHMEIAFQETLANILGRSPAAKKVKSNVTSAPKRGAPTRRRSYGEKDPMTTKKLSEKVVEKKMNKSESLDDILAKSKEETTPRQNLEKIEEKDASQGDSWDSVAAQPSCIICGIVFNTLAKLNTHTKYSVCIIIFY